ncbi:MAG TPA: MYXO-CTERM sorting domain-containing protein [Haliangium sp.]|nr:MYXO-CTERM sorting domain-containing protein [Haliangium sp.]
MLIRKVWSGLLALGTFWITAVAAVTGCGGGGRRSGFEPVVRYIDETPPAPLRTPDQVAATLVFSNPERVMFTATSLPLILDTDARAVDPRCPRFIDQSDMEAQIVDWRIQGGCTVMDELGAMTRYEGQIVAKGDASGTLVRYEDFKTVETVECDAMLVKSVLTLKGEVQVPFAFLLDAEAEPEEPEDPREPMGGYGYRAGRYVMSVLLESVDVDEECNSVTTGLAYDVRMDIQDEGEGAMGRDVVQMEGHAARRDTAPLMDEPATIGSWKLSAADYTMASNVCSTEPLAGTLTVQAGGDEATVSPDGATSCDESGDPPCAPWSLNGEAQPEQICDYTGCSAGPDAPPPWIALAMLLGGLLWQRRHRRGRTRL